MFFVTQLFFCSSLSFSLTHLYFQLGLVRIVPIYSKIEFLSSYRKTSKRKWAEKCENLFSVDRYFSRLYYHIGVYYVLVEEKFLLYFGANAWTRQCVAQCRAKHQKCSTIQLKYGRVMLKWLWKLNDLAVFRLIFCFAILFLSFCHSPWAKIVWAGNFPSLKMKMSISTSSAISLPHFFFYLAFAFDDVS